jgi:hypothetical protein
LVAALLSISAEVIEDQNTIMFTTMTGR